MPLNRDEFLKTLSESNLLTAEQLDSVGGDSRADADPRATARRVVQRGWLTPWQAQQLLAGRSKLFLGKYKLLQSLGQGGMGAVFKAEQPSLKRIVAIKVMARHVLQNKDAVSRFLREIRTVAALDHPHIVAAYDADCAAQTYFLVMEYVPGIDLKRWIVQQGRLPIGWSCEVVRQAALGLQHAHEHGLVHRDIKPANLLIVRPSDNPAAAASGGVPKVKILDLGLARFASDAQSDGNLTNTGQIMGTPDYIAPEQAENTKKADIRADVYSLGCTLFEMLTGSVPFEGETAMQKVLARINGTAPRLKSLRPDVPATLDEIVARMMARDPSQRQQTPAEVARQLEPFALSTSPQSTQQTMLMEPDVPISSPPPATAGSVEERPDTTLNGFLNALGSQAAQTPTAFSVPAVRSTRGRRPRRVTPQATIAATAVFFGVVGLLAWQMGRGRSDLPSSILAVSNGEPQTKIEAGAAKVDQPSLIADGTDEPGDFLVRLASPDWTWTPLENLGRQVNSSKPDRSPTVTADGLLLVFASQRGSNHDLYECVRTSADEPFGSATALTTVNSADVDESPFVAADGLTLVYSSRRSGSGDGDLYVSRRASRRQPWGAPERLSDLVNSKQWDSGPQLTPDGLMLVFHSNRNGGSGRSDLWMSRRESLASDWGPAVNLGPDINGPDEDRHPGLTPDGKGLMFLRGSEDAESVRFARLGRNGRWNPFAREIRDAEFLRMACLSPDGKTAYVTVTSQGRRGVGDHDLWRTQRVRKSSPDTPPPPSALDPSFAADKAGAEWDGNVLKMTFCWCPDGSFTMGSPADEANRNPDEDQVQATLTGFWMGQFEVTQEEWVRVMDTSLAEQAEKATDVKNLAGEGARHPMYHVSRDDGAEFARKLTEQERAAGRLPDGWEYRLPSEAQWEYACRAGTTTRFSSGDSEEGLKAIAWFSANAGDVVTREVGTKQANAWGLHDMHGNVEEWCRDAYASLLPGGKDPVTADRTPFGVCRGGSWAGDSHYLRAAKRQKGSTEYRGNSVGFRIAIVRVKAGHEPPSLAVAPFDAAQAKAHQAAWAKHFGATVDETNSIGMKLAVVPPGRFTMGSASQGPTREVRISRPFQMGRTHVTVGEFRKFVEATKHVTEIEQGLVDDPPDKSRDWRSPGYPGDDSSPVTRVTWNDAVRFCNWLSARENRQPCYRQNAQGAWERVPEGKGYRLPTEAEWEFACRAGTQSTYYWGDDWAQADAHGWTNRNGQSRCHPVGTKRPNAFGLFDMHGNAWNWCQDWHARTLDAASPVDDPQGPATGEKRVARGGAWDSPDFYSTDAFRLAAPANSKSVYGFRVVREIVDAGETANDGATANTINLLPLIDPPRDRIVGTWRLNPEGELLSDNAASACLQLPYRPPEEYDLRVDFTRVEGKDALVQVLRAGGGNFFYAIGAFGNQSMHLGDIAPYTEVRKERWLENGRRHVSRVEVRRDTIRMFLDGERIAELKNYTQHYGKKQYELKDKSALGLGSNVSPAVFHRVEITEISGPGEFVRSDEPAARKAAEGRRPSPFDGDHLEPIGSGLD